MPKEDRRQIRFFHISSIAFLVVLTDRLAKHIVFTSMQPNESFAVIPGALYMTLVLNDGAAFGLFGGLNSLFKVFSVAAIAAIIFFAWRHEAKNRVLYTALALILGGAVGNLIDRAVFGFVIDFIDVRVWPVFNIADSAITIGFLMLAFNIIFCSEKA